MSHHQDNRRWRRTTEPSHILPYRAAPCLITSHIVISCNILSHIVTSCHTLSHQVTICHNIKTITDGGRQQSQEASRFLPVGQRAASGESEENDVINVINVINIPHICLFFTHANFLENKIYTEKRVNYDKIHSKLPIFCVITAKYTVNCQFFALNL